MVRQARQPIADGPTALYWLYDNNKEPIYVGISHRLQQRWSEHARDKAWWPEVKSREVTWFSTRFEAMGAEQDAILRTCPRYNEQLGARSLPLPRFLLKQRPYPDLVYAYWQAENETLAAYQAMAKAVIRALDRGADAEAVADAVGMSRTHVVRLHEQWKANRQRRREAREDRARLQARAKERAAAAALQPIAPTRRTDRG